MKFEEYVPLAMRTKNENDVESSVLNACLGLAGEYAEYQEAETKEHKLEELGDIHWYVALLADSLDIELGASIPIEESTLSLIGLVCDKIKKIVFQGHQLELGFFDITVSKLVSSLSQECVKLDTTQSAIMEKNVAKLKARFPDGFEVEKSVNRKG